MKKTNTALALAATLALVGCGGGSGGSEEQGGVPNMGASVALTGGNYDAVSIDVVTSIAGTGSIFDALDFLAEDAEGTAGSPYAALGTGQIGPITTFALKQLSAGLKVRETAKVVYTETVPCVSGSLVVTANDADNNDDISAGDTISLSARQCVFTSGQPAVNGSFSMKVNSVSYDRFGDLISADFGVAFSSFSSADVSLNGAANVVLSGDSVTLTYNGLTARLKNQTLVYNYTLVARPNGITVNGQLGLNGSTYALSTPQLITLGYVYPNGGQLKIADGTGAYVISTFQPTGYVNRLFLAGDDLVDATSELHRW